MKLYDENQVKQAIELSRAQILDIKFVFTEEEILNQLAYSMPPSNEDIAIRASQYIDTKDDLIGKTIKAVFMEGSIWAINQLEKKL